MDSTNSEHMTEELRLHFAAQCKAMVLGDVTELDSLLADDFSLLHMTGYRQAKAAWLADIDDDRLQYHHIEVVELQATVTGHGPQLTARTLTEATIWGAYSTWRLQLQQTFRPEDGHWLAQRCIARSW